jgi:hypothetical protein
MTMIKPSDMTCYVDECPKCGREGEGVYYMPRDIAPADDCLQFAVNHCINGQKNTFAGANRNDFCFIRFFKHADDGEITTTRKATPHAPPDWKAIKRILKRSKRS